MCDRSKRSKPAQLLAALLVLLTATCVENPAPRRVDWLPDAPQPDPLPGQTRFVSADYGGMLAADDRSAVDDLEPAADGDERVVEEGDIYRLLGGGLVANINTYRGLQLISVADPSKPTIVGAARFAGDPFEMYAVGGQLVALVNGWRGYFGERDDVRVTTHDGGAVIVVDVSDPNAPRLLREVPVAGQIRASRMVREGDATALYVVATNEGQTAVRSFAVELDGSISAAGELLLDGNVTAIHATPTRLLVARDDGDDPAAPSSAVTLIDISDPGGAVAEGGTVVVSGFVESQFNMDVYGDILRVVSTSTWQSPELARPSRATTRDGTTSSPSPPVASTPASRRHSLRASRSKRRTSMPSSIESETRESS